MVYHHMVWFVLSVRHPSRHVASARIHIYFGAGRRAVVGPHVNAMAIHSWGIARKRRADGDRRWRCVWCSEAGIAVGSSDLVKYTENHGASWVDRPTNLPFAGLDWHSIQYVPTSGH